MRNQKFSLSRTNFGRYDEEEDDSSRVSGGRFRSRFLRGDDDEDTAGGGNRSSIYEESGGDKSKNKTERIKVVETEDCSRGPLSGCIRLADSSRVIQRIKVSGCFDFFLYSSDKMVLPTVTKKFQIS